MLSCLYGRTEGLLFLQVYWFSCCFEVSWVRGKLSKATVVQSHATKVIAEGKNSETQCKVTRVVLRMTYNSRSRLNESSWKFSRRYVSWNHLTSMLTWIVHFEVTNLWFIEFSCETESLIRRKSSPPSSRKSRLTHTIRRQKTNILFSFVLIANVSSLSKTFCHHKLFTNCVTLRIRLTKL